MKRLAITTMLIAGLATTLHANTPTEKDPSNTSWFSLNKMYAGLSLNALGATDSDSNVEVLTSKAGQTRFMKFSYHLGYALHDNIDMEGRLTGNVGMDGDLVIDKAWSVLLKPKYDLFEFSAKRDGINTMYIYGLVGYGGVEMYSKSSKATTNVDDTGFQYGVGVGVAFTDVWNLYLDYTKLGSDLDGVYFGKSGANFGSISAGININF